MRRNEIHHMRLASAAVALDIASHEPPDEQERIVDLVTNLLHYAESKHVPVDYVLRVALNHYNEERKEEATQHA